MQLPTLAMLVLLHLQIEYIIIIVMHLYIYRAPCISSSTAPPFFGNFESPIVQALLAGRRWRQAQRQL